jgi:MurNAc alpha-1-phosphate uridylyltransferase
MDARPTRRARAPQGNRSQLGRESGTVLHVQAVILAGGLGTRMHPRTLAVPKALLEVNGRPFIDWQLEKLATSGFQDILLCIGYLGEQIEAHIGSGGRHGLRVLYAKEGARLLGTGGALRAALDCLEPTFLVTYGDSYLPFDYSGPLRTLDAHEDCDGVMSVYRNNGRFDASNVALKGDWVALYAKGGKDPALDCIDYGAIALRRELVAALKAGEVAGLEPLLRGLAERHRLRAHVVAERFFEVGSPQGLADLEAFLGHHPA